MRDKLNQFIDNTNGQFIEVSYAPALYQCMDLVYLWIFILGFPKATIQHQYAYEVYTKASDFTRQFFEIIENKLETIPEVGDLFVINKTSSNVAGHIGIVIEATQSRMKCFEQNSPLGTNAHIQDRGYTGVLGLLKPKNVIIDGVPQWLTTLLQERCLTITNESEIRNIFEKAKKYDDEVKSLQEQVKVANEQLADKALEVSDLVSKNEGLTSKVEELEKLYVDTKTERDTLSWEKQKLDLQVKTLQEEIASLNERIEKLASDVPLDGIPALELIKAVFQRFWKRRG